MDHFDPGVFAALYGTDLGKRLWALLNTADNLVRMETATALERPAVEGVEEQLLREFGEAVLEDRVKQMIGRMVRQIMERRGYVLDVGNVKMTSGAPFSRATRYKLPDDMTFHVFKSHDDPRNTALTTDKAGTRLLNDTGARWTYWKSFRGGVRGRIAFDLQDEAKARSDIVQQGYHLHRIERLVRAS
jgi:hypothetical protein